jgi:hypothetical protein
MRRRTPRPRTAERLGPAGLYPGGLPTLHRAGRELCSHRRPPISSPAIDPDSRNATGGLICEINRGGSQNYVRADSRTWRESAFNLLCLKT